MDPELKKYIDENPELKEYIENYLNLKNKIKNSYVKIYSRGLDADKEIEQRTKIIAFTTDIDFGLLYRVYVRGSRTFYSVNEQKTKLSIINNIKEYIFNDHVSYIEISFINNDRKNIHNGHHFVTIDFDDQRTDVDEYTFGLDKHKNKEKNELFEKYLMQALEKQKTMFE